MHLSRLITALIVSTLFLFNSPAMAQKKLTVGVTLHPYYSWVANIAGDTVNLQTVIPDNVDPHSYQARPQDLENLATMDVIVVNTLGHDGYIESMLKAAGRSDIPRIKPNTGIALIPSAHKSYQLKSDSSEKVSYNSHTYVALLGAVQQINTIAAELGKLAPEHAELYLTNAEKYGKKLKKMLRSALKTIRHTRNNDLTIATVHDGYAYLFQELGIKTDAVIQPRHGIEPSARQLADTIKRINRAKANVLFTEIDYQKKYVDTIFEETGCRLYSLSHISNGPYAADKFEKDMQRNIDTIIKALTDPAVQQTSGS